MLDNVEPIVYGILSYFQAIYIVSIFKIILNITNYQ